MAYNKLKDLITEPTLYIKKKFLDPYDIDNLPSRARVQQQLRALKLDDKDRRWFAPEVTEELREPGFGTGIMTGSIETRAIARSSTGRRSSRESQTGWSGGVRTADRNQAEGDRGHRQPGHVRVAIHLQLDHGRVPHRRTGEKLEVNSACGPTMMNVIKCAREKMPIVGLDTDAQRGVVTSVYAERRPDRLESESTLRKIASGAGLFVGKDRLQSRTWHQATRPTSSPTLGRWPTPTARPSPRPRSRAG